jgi:hypothetical protein
VRSNLAALLEDDDAHLFPGLGLELFEADGGTEACGAAADDADVDELFFTRFRVGVVQLSRGVQGGRGVQEARVAGERRAQAEAG